MASTQGGLQLGQCGTREPGRQAWLRIVTPGKPTEGRPGELQSEVTHRTGSGS